MVRWPLQPLQPPQKTQLQPPVWPSVDSLCHPWFTATNLSYRFPILETSATALCGTTGIYPTLGSSDHRKRPQVPWHFSAAMLACPRGQFTKRFDFAELIKKTDHPMLLVSLIGEVWAWAHFCVGMRCSRYLTGGSMFFLISESDRFSDGDAVDTVMFGTGQMLCFLIYNFFLSMSEHGAPEQPSMPKPVEYWKLIRSYRHHHPYFFDKSCLKPGSTWTTGWKNSKAHVVITAITP